MSGMSVHCVVKGEGDARHPVQEPDILCEMSKPVEMPLKFEGSTSWEAFSAQFEIVSQSNGWKGFISGQKPQGTSHVSFE